MLPVLEKARRVVVFGEFVSGSEAQMGHEGSVLGVLVFTLIMDVLLPQSRGRFSDPGRLSF